MAERLAAKNTAFVARFASLNKACHRGNDLRGSIQCPQFLMSDKGKPEIDYFGPTSKV